MTAPTLTTKLDRESPEAKARFAHNHALAQQLRAAVAEAAELNAFKAKLEPVMPGFRKQIGEELMKTVESEVARVRKP